MIGSPFCRATAITLSLLVGVLPPRMVTASAPNWQLLGRNDAAAVSVDTANIRWVTTIPGTKPKPQVWALLNYSKPQSRQGGKFKSTKILFRFDCEVGQYAVLSILNYSGTDGEGDVIARAEPGEAAAREYLVPGSDADAVETNVCGLKH